MNRTVIIITAILIISCQTRNPKELTLNKDIKQDVITVDTTLNHPIQSIKLPLNIDSIIGMTNIELGNKFKLFSCSGGLIENDTVKYGISVISSSQNDCNVGQSYVLLERFIKHTNDGKAIFIITDYIKLDSNFNTRNVAYNTCYENNKRNEYIVSLGENSLKGKYQKLLKVWKINLNTEHFCLGWYSTHFAVVVPFSLGW